MSKEKTSTDIDENTVEITLPTIDLHMMGNDCDDHIFLNPTGSFDIKAIERRMRDRFWLSAQVLISNHVNIFKSETVNISTSGILLKDIIPDHFKKTSCEIIVQYRKSDGSLEKLTFTGKVIGHQMPSSRIQLIAARNNSDQRLETIISEMGTERVG